MGLCLIQKCCINNYSKLKLRGNLHLQEHQDYHKIIKLFRLEETFKTIKSNH